MGRDTRKTVRGTLFYSLSIVIGGAISMYLGLDPTMGAAIGGVIMGVLEKGYRLLRGRWGGLAALDPVLDQPLEGD